MFKELMIDPELWGDWVFSSAVFPQLGTENGRLVSCFPRGKQQLQNAYQAITEKIEGQPRKKEKLKIRAKRAIEECSFKNPYRDNQVTGNWLGVVTDEICRLPVDVIVTEKGIDNAMLPEDISDGLDCWVIPQTSQIKKQQPLEMIAALESLIRLSRRLIFVDNYFDPGSRQFSNFSACFMRKIKEYPAISRVDFHFGKNDVSESYLSDWLEEQTTGWGKSPEFNFYKWDEGDLHYRVLLSDVGGVSSEYGFDSRSQIESGVPADFSLFTRLGKNDFESMFTSFSQQYIQSNAVKKVFSKSAVGI